MEKRFIADHYTVILPECRSYVKPVFCLSNAFRFFLAAVQKYFIYLWTIIKRRKMPVTIQSDHRVKAERADHTHTVKHLQAAHYNCNRICPTYPASVDMKTDGGLLN